MARGTKIAPGLRAASTVEPSDKVTANSRASSRREP